ncbi:MAG TPA: hypothetical protein VFD48_13485, partial [Pyrinomonadaceae bacterium]|nr:hypothetical protein [Pyrinomonadaceae bacterium]
MDLKSVVRKNVRVRLPPSAPLSTFPTTTTCIVPLLKLTEQNGNRNVVQCTKEACEAFLSR